MAKSRPLVGGFLERISVKAFEKYHAEITELVQTQHGVYALYKNDRLYYVGLASNLRRRVKQHLKDKHGGRWNRFSLYLVRKVDHIKEIESLLLRIADPTGNRKGGRLRRAANLKQQLRRMMETRQKRELDEILSQPRRARQTAAKTTGRSKAGKRTASKRRTRPRPAKATTRGRSTDAPWKDIAGGKNIYATFKKREYKAHVFRNGRIKYNGQNYYSLSAAAVAVTGRPTNGWSFWKVRHKGELVRLSDLR